MTWWLTYGGWIAAGVLALVAAWFYAVVEDERARRARQQIRAEEAEAWSDEHKRTANALQAELDGLRERHYTLTELYGEAVRRLLIRAEEAEAWSDEHKRTANALQAELDGLRERHYTLTELYGEAVRRLLASNYVIVHRNLEWKRRRPDSADPGG